MNTLVLGLFLLLGRLALRTAPEQAPMPPAEQQFRMWLERFNHGDGPALVEFLDTQYPSHGAGAEQQFRPVSVGDGYYQFVARHSGKCLDVPGAATGSDARLEQRTCNGSASQAFQLTLVTSANASPAPHSTPSKNRTDTLPASNDAYRVVNRSSAKCVEAAAGATLDGTAVQQNTCNGKDAQVWVFIVTDSDYYRVQTKRDLTRGWDVGGAVDGARIQLWRNVEDMDELLGFLRMTGGFEFKKAEESEQTRFRGLGQERDSDQFVRFTVEVEPAQPYHITRLDIRAIARPAEFAIPRMRADELAAALSAKLETDSTADKFAGTVLLARNGKTVFSGAYGFADRDRQIPNKLSTRFNIGSMNKMFTATAVLQLVQTGKIDLQDPVGKYLTDYPNKEIATKVTIHQLLTHTGGTGDIFGPQFDPHRKELRTLEDYVRVYGQRGPAFEPGSRWAYSNYGFLLLGLIIETVSGVHYYDYIRDKIYKPAGMMGSGSFAEDETVPDRAVGYVYRGGTWKPNRDTLPYRGTSAGGGYSTVEDLARFASALRANRFLDAHYTDLLTTGKVDTPRGKYAYGFEEMTVDGARNFGHGGGAPGVSAGLRIYPESGWVIVVLSNLDASAGRISQYIANRLPVGP